MLDFDEAIGVFWNLPVLILLSGRVAKPKCDFSETRNAVLHAVLDDHSNKLAEYAAKNSTMAKSKEVNSDAEKAEERPQYILSDKIVTTSTSKDNRTLKCSSSISARVGDTKASKEVDFTVQQLSDGKITVSVDPFQF